MRMRMHGDGVCMVKVDERHARPIRCVALRGASSTSFTLLLLTINAPRGWVGTDAPPPLSPCKAPATSNSTCALPAPCPAPGPRRPPRDPRSLPAPLDEASGVAADELDSDVLVVAPDPTKYGPATNHLEPAELREEAAKGNVYRWGVSPCD